MNIEATICSAVISGVKALYGQDVPEKMVQLQKTKREFEGNLTLVVFPLLKISKKKPEDTAEDLGRYLWLRDSSTSWSPRRLGQGCSPTSTPTRTTARRPPPPDRPW